MAIRRRRVQPILSGSVSRPTGATGRKVREEVICPISNYYVRSTQTRRHAQFEMGATLMAYEALREAVWKANLGLVKAGLVILTWGNVSGIDRESGVVAIKPSGVDYDTLKPKDIVLVRLGTGEIIEGNELRPSSDTPTHLELYRSFPAIGGVVHTHSSYATSWAQACREIPCYGTTHADSFFGPVPLCRHLTPEEIIEAYEANTGRVIVERFAEPGLNPDHLPGALLPNHGPFAWGATPDKAVENAIVLEEIAKMATRAESLNPDIQPIRRALLDKHFLRKHGANAYYGQKR